jgi:hypothetical protein
LRSREQGPTFHFTQSFELPLQGIQFDPGGYQSRYPSGANPSFPFSTGIFWIAEKGPSSQVGQGSPSVLSQHLGLTRQYKHQFSERLQAVSAGIV